MAGMIGAQLYAKKRVHNVLQGLETICEDTSKQYSQLSFQVRFDYILRAVGGGYNGNQSNHNSGLIALNYIEVNVTDIEASSVVSAYSYGDAGLGGPSAFPLVAESLLGGEQKSAAVRLRDLDEMRGMLSQEEYDRKKKDILDSV